MVINREFLTAYLLQCTMLYTYLYYVCIYIYIYTYIQKKCIYIYIYLFISKYVHKCTHMPYDAHCNTHNIILCVKKILTYTHTCRRYMWFV